VYTPDEYISFLKDEFEHMPWRDSVVCYLLFGSLVNIPSLTLNRDVDLCFVLRSRSADVLGDVREYLHSRFVNPDVTVYYVEELDAPLPFRDIGNGLFALEYLALGTTIYGRNIFVDMLERASRVDYRRSLLEKIFDYVLRIRRCFLVERDDAAKLAYVDKYLQRLIVDILLFREAASLASLSAMHREDVFTSGAKEGLFNQELLSTLTAADGRTEQLKASFQCFSEVSVALLGLDTSII